LTPPPAELDAAAELVVGEVGHHDALQPHPLRFQVADAAVHGVAPFPEAGLQQGQGMDVPVDAAASLPSLEASSLASNA